MIILYYYYLQSLVLHALLKFLLPSSSLVCIRQLFPQNSLQPLSPACQHLSVSFCQACPERVNQMKIHTVYITKELRYRCLFQLAMTVKKRIRYSFSFFFTFTLSSSKNALDSLSLSVYLQIVFLTMCTIYLVILWYLLS